MATKGLLRPDPFRIWIAGAEMQVVVAPPGVEEAYEIMLADNVPAQRAADMALACAKTGKDPVAFANHFVKNRKALREMRNGQ